jgi:hypothetical protein
MGFPVVFPWVFPSPASYTPANETFGDLTWNGDHSAEAIDLLLHQFHGSSLVEGYVKSYVNRVQELENAIWEILLALDIDNAVNAQLEGIGAIVGEGRRGRLDGPYRAAIRVRILVNLCDGKHAQIVRILTAYLGATDGDGTIRLTEPAPAALSLQVFTVPVSPGDLRTMARSIKPAGVNLDGRYATHATRMYRFGWTSAITGVTGANNGDGWTDGSVGGQLAGRI